MRTPQSYPTSFQATSDFFTLSLFSPSKRNSAPRGHPEKASNCLNHPSNLLEVFAVTFATISLWTRHLFRVRSVSQPFPSVADPRHLPPFTSHTRSFSTFRAPGASLISWRPPPICWSFSWTTTECCANSPSTTPPGKLSRSGLSTAFARANACSRRWTCRRRWVTDAVLVQTRDLERSLLTLVSH
jgi:hypothetical protein